MGTIEKLYFDSELERDAYNAAEAMFRGCDMEHTVYWYEGGEDKTGFYILA